MEYEIERMNQEDPGTSIKIVLDEIAFTENEEAKKNASVGIKESYGQRFGNESNLHGNDQIESQQKIQKVSEHSSIK